MNWIAKWLKKYCSFSWWQHFNDHSIKLSLYSAFHDQRPSQSANNQPNIKLFTFCNDANSFWRDESAADYPSGLGSKTGRSYVQGPWCRKDILVGKQRTETNLCPLFHFGTTWLLSVDGATKSLSEAAKSPSALNILTGSRCNRISHCIMSKVYISFLL